MSNIPVVDMVFLVIITLLVIRGYIRGFITEFFAWVAVLLSIWVAVLLHQNGAAFIRGRIMEDVEHIPEILAFVGIFIIVMIFVKMVQRILRDIIVGAKLGGADKLLGAVFGLLEGLTLTALLFFLLSVQQLFDASSVIEGSTLARILLPIIRVPIERSVELINPVYVYLLHCREAALQMPQA